MPQPQQKGLLWDNAGHSHGCRPNADAGLQIIVLTSRIGTPSLPKGMGCPTDRKQAAMEPEKFLAPFATEKASSRLSSKTVWKSDPTGLVAILFQNSSVRRHQKTCSGANPNSSSNIALGVAYLTPQMCLRYLEILRSPCASLSEPDNCRHVWFADNDQIGPHEPLPSALRGDVISGMDV